MKSLPSQRVYSLFPFVIWRHRPNDWRLLLRGYGSHLVWHTTIRGQESIVLSFFAITGLKLLTALHSYDRATRRPTEQEDRLIKHSCNHIHNWAAVTFASLCTYS
jgi:hypothetical protein